jgi:DNA-binding NarL/FixJ family response regulator
MLLDGLARHHLLVFAPSGFGKSTLLGLWQRILVDRGEPVIPVEGFAATEEAMVEFLVGLDARVTPHSTAYPDRAAATVLLDNADRFTNRQLQQLVSALAGKARIVLAVCRPVPEEVLNGSDDDFRHIGSQDLGYTLEETRAALGRFDGTGLGETDVRQVFEMSLGWPFVIGLLRSRMQRELPGAELDMAIARSMPTMLQFIDDHLFMALPDEIKTFLVTLSPLERFCGDLAHAVTGNPGAWALCERLERLGVPLTRSGAMFEWMSLHPIFLTFLRQRSPLSATRQAEVHLAAATWQAAQGQAAVAVTHALQAGAAEMAAGIIDESGGWRHVVRGEGEMLARIFDRIEEGAVALHPSFGAGLALHLGRRGDLSGAREILASLPATDALSRRVRDDLVVVEAILDGYEDKPFLPEKEGALRNLAARRGHHDPLSLAVVNNVLAARSLHAGRFPEVLQLGEVSARAYEASGAVFGAGLVQCHMIQALQFMGRNRKALDLIAQVEGRAAMLGQSGETLLATLALLKAAALVGSEPARAADLLCANLLTVEEGDAWHDVLAAGYKAALSLPVALEQLGGREALLRRAATVAARRNLRRMSMLLVTIADDPLRGELLAGLPPMSDWPPDPYRPVTETTPRLLSNREAEVLRLMAGGLTVKEMAGPMGISENTVKYHAKRLFKRLGTSRRSLVLSKAREMRLL